MCKFRTFVVFVLFFKYLFYGIINDGKTMVVVSTALLPSFFEQVHTGVWCDGRRMLHVIRAVVSMFEFQTVIQENVYYHRLEFIYGVRPTWATEINKK